MRQPSSLTPTKVIPASDDDDTEVEEPPIATPAASSNDKTDGLDVAVASADLSPGAMEVDNGSKPETTATLLASNKLGVREVTPAPSTPLAADDPDQPTERKARQPSDDDSMRDDFLMDEPEDWAMNLD